MERNMRWIEYLIYFFLFIIPWQTRLILRHGVLNNGNWEYGIVGIYGTEILLWIIVLLFGSRSSSSTVCQFLFFAADSSPRLQKRNWHTAFFVIFSIFIASAVFILLASDRL